MTIESKLKGASHKEARSNGTEAKKTVESKIWVSRANKNFCSFSHVNFAVS